MALTLKPRLERSSDGSVAIAIHIDGADGQSLGIVGPFAYDNEDDARSGLRSELRKHLHDLAAAIVVDGIDFAGDVDHAVEAVVLDAGTALLDKLQTAKLRSGPVSISDPSAAMPARRAK